MQRKLLLERDLRFSCSLRVGNCPGSWDCFLTLFLLMVGWCKAWAGEVKPKLSLTPVRDLQGEPTVERVACEALRWSWLGGLTAAFEAHRHPRLVTFHGFPGPPHADC